MFVPLLLTASLAQASDDIKLVIDAREAMYGIIHTLETVPVKPGKLVLAYPRWHDGNHRPTGPINGMTNLHFRAGARQLDWKRDPVDLFHFQLDIPDGVSSIDAEFDFLGEPKTDFSHQMSRLPWNQYLLSPVGKKHSEIRFSTSVTLPEGWKLGTALLKDPGTTQKIDLPTVSLTELVDSPGLAGKNVTKIPVGPVESLVIASDAETPTPFVGDYLDYCKRLIAEANSLFGAKHYRKYDFLISISDEGGWQGLEHHESSEDGIGAKDADSPQRKAGTGELLSHEYTHSWNGKYRRPYDLYTTDYDTPQQGDLLWVYEGMTQFWGDVLSARAGFYTPEQFRESEAMAAADLMYTSGRSWRPLEDTATSVQLIRGAPVRWYAERRGGDYYPESVFIWMEVDSILRAQTKGAKSLDDFCKAFHGGTSGGPEVKTYTFDDVVNTLNAIAPYDWAALLKSRVQSLQPQLSLAGFENDGWRFVFNDKPNTWGRAPLESWFALGLGIENDGVITEVIRTLPAGAAGIRPGMKVLAANGLAFSQENLKKVLASRMEIDLIVQDGDVVKTVHVPYKDGLKYPHFIRDESKPDVLSDVIKQTARP